MAVATAVETVTDDVPVARIGHTATSPEGENSTYLLAGGLVVDPGPPGETAWDRLQTGIEAAGWALTDVTDVVVTHWHVDHAGLAPRLVDAADATIHMHRADAPLVADYAAARERRVARDAAALGRWGVPVAVCDRVRADDAPSPLPATTPVRAHGDGDRVAGRRLYHAPGHTLGHVVLADGAGSGSKDGDLATLYAGDAVLPTYTPNVGGSDTRYARPDETAGADGDGTDVADGRAGQALTDYLTTLDRLETLVTDATTVRPGHGDAVDLPGRVPTIRSHHARRVRAAVAVIDRIGPATPWTVATELFGEMEGIHAKMGAGEAAAHLGVAADGGLLSVTERTDGAESGDDDGGGRAVTPLLYRRTDRPVPDGLAVLDRTGPP